LLCVEKQGFVTAYANIRDDFFDSALGIGISLVPEDFRTGE
jgi:hypothetical protein